MIEDRIYYNEGQTCFNVSRLFGTSCVVSLCGFVTSSWVIYYRKITSFLQNFTHFYLIPDIVLHGSVPATSAYATLIFTLAVYVCHFSQNNRYTTGSFILFLLLAGDVKPNPGPGLRQCTQSQVVHSIACAQLHVTRGDSHCLLETVSKSIHAYFTLNK